jgi:hypothetical protein
MGNGTVPARHYMYRTRHSRVQMIETKNRKPFGFRLWFVRTLTSGFSVRPFYSFLINPYSDPDPYPDPDLNL